MLSTLFYRYFMIHIKNASVIQEQVPVSHIFLEQATVAYTQNIKCSLTFNLCLCLE